MKKGKKCNCSVCKQHAKWYRLMKKYDFTKADRAFLEHIYATLDCVELDNEVHDAVMDGSWPSAEERLREALKKSMEYKKEAEEKEKKKYEEIEREMKKKLKGNLK